MAVARPVATAIAGITPAEASALGIPIGGAGKFKTILREGGTKKYGLLAASAQFERGLLVGPGFESRISGQKVEAANDDGLAVSTESDDGIEKKDEAFTKPEENEVSHRIEPISVPHQSVHQYPFIPPVSPFRFHWNSEPLEQSPGYEPIPFYDQRAYTYPQFYPFPNVLPPINGYHFQQRY